jgi:N-acetylglucosamine-6-phosphate deacetylase
LIPDLVHVERETVLVTLAAAPGRVAVTTDAVAAAGVVDPGSSGGAARLADGTLAGGLATPVELMRNLVDIGCPLEVAAMVCSAAARRLLGLDPAAIRPGDVADLVVLDDAFAVRSTYVDGVDVLDV